ncbi:MAG: hypothetical protein Q9168_005324 [Polycauliona sp. 1 TL-2023]
MGLCGTAPLNCTPWSAAEHRQILEADPDIAGIGFAKVMVVFIFTSLMTIAIAALGLFYGLIRGLESNAIDRWALFLIQKMPASRIGESKFMKWQPIMEALILTLSDQQLLVGTSILITGFTKHCTISVYHFGLVSDLAWFSSTTHMTSLSVLQVYLFEHPPLRKWRVYLMFFILVLLMVAFLLEGHRYWHDRGYLPAQCLFDEFPSKWGGWSAKWAVIRMVLLAYNYSTSILSLFEMDKICALHSKRPLRRMDRSIASLQKRIGASNSNGALTSYANPVLRIGLAIVFGARWLYIGMAAFVNSVVIELCGDLIFFGLGVWGIWDERAKAKAKFWMEGSENTWGFGQLVQVLLLSSIATTFIDLKYSSKSTSESSRSRVDVSD